jgi:hypothetical protein
MQGRTADNQVKIPIGAKLPGIGHMPADAAAFTDPLSGQIYHRVGYI